MQVAFIAHHCDVTSLMILGENADVMRFKILSTQGLCKEASLQAHAAKQLTHQEKGAHDLLVRLCPFLLS